MAELSFDPLDAKERIAERLGYPFRHFELNPEAQSWVRDELVALTERYSLFESPEEWKELIAIFVKHCCPEAPSEPAVRQLCHFLYMTLFFNEARTRGFPLEWIEDYFRMLRGQRASSSHAVVTAARDFRPAIVRLTEHSPSDASAFFHYLALNLSSFCQEQRLRESNPDPDSFLAVRIHSISALGFLQFWKLLLELDARDELRFATDLFRLELLSAKLQALANDLCSFPRDLATKGVNLIRVVMTHEKTGAREAFHRVWHWHESTVEEYRIAATRLGDAQPPEPVRRYQDFIASCIWGNLKSMRELSSRYS